MDVLSYQPQSGKYSPFPQNELLLISKFRAPSSRQSSIPDQNKPAGGVSQLREVDYVDGDESGYDELPSLSELLSPATHAPRNPPRAHSLNHSVQTARSSAPTLSGATSSPQRPLFNHPEWSIFYPSAQASKPEIHAEANDGNSQENPMVIDGDHDDGDLTDRSDHTSHQMTINDLGVEGENTDRDAGGAAHPGEGVANSDPDDAVMSQGDDRSAIATSTSFSPEIPESDSATTLDEERQLDPSVQEDPLPSPSGKRSHTLDRADGRGGDWVFDVFAKNDSGTEGDGSPPSKRARSSPPPLKVVANRPSPAAAVVVKGVEMPGRAYGDRPLRGDQEYEVHQIVGASESEYEVTAFMKLWLPKASVDPKLVRKYRAEQRAVTRVRTRWSSRLQSKK